MVEFDSEKDRDYYVSEDPAHEDFKVAAAKVGAKAQVVDFTPGVF